MTKSLNILGITLARGGSKSIPRKNIKLINGKPLIAYTIRAASESKYLTDYIVSTDDLEIANVAKEYGANVPFIRPPELASDTASSVSALQHAVDAMETLNDLTYDYIVELMATNPLKSTQDIDACIEILVSSNCDSVIAMNIVEDNHPARIKKIENGYIRDFCIPEPNEARRQDLEPKAYIRSGSIYALNRDHLMNDGMRYGSINSRPFILPNERVINIDNIDDFHLAEYKLKSLQE